MCTAHIAESVGAAPARNFTPKNNYRCWHRHRGKSGSLRAFYFAFYFGRCADAIKRSFLFYPFISLSSLGASVPKSASRKLRKPPAEFISSAVQTPAFAFANRFRGAQSIRVAPIADLRLQKSAWLIVFQQSYINALVFHTCMVWRRQRVSEEWSPLTSGVDFHRGRFFFVKWRICINCQMLATSKLILAKNTLRSF